MNHNESITKEFDSKAVKFKREMLRDVLNQCTEKQIAFFNRMYGSIDAISESKMRHAYFQCVKTIEKNQKDKP